MKSKIVWFSVVYVTDKSDKEWRKIERRLEREKVWTEDWELLSLYQVLTDQLVMPDFAHSEIVESSDGELVWAGVEVEYVT